MKKQHKAKEHGRGCPHILDQLTFHRSQPDTGFPETFPSSLSFFSILKKLISLASSTDFERKTSSSFGARETDPIPGSLVLQSR